MRLVERLKTWWQQRQCSHWNSATRTWFDGAAVVRETVCLSCGKTVPCPPIDHSVLLGLLDEAKALSESKSR